MAGFAEFTTPLWEIFAGNILLLVCSLFYLAWWIVVFRPDSPAGPAGGFFITAALITGLASIFLLSAAINNLSATSAGFPVKYVLLAAAALFAVLLPITAIGFGRAVTSELLIIHIWAALELSIVAVLQGTGRLGTGSATVLAVLVVLGLIVSLVCYVLYYRLDPMASYLDGMVPLITSALVSAIMSGVLVFSRSGCQ